LSDIKIREPNPLRCHPVDVRRANVARTVTADVRVARSSQKMTTKLGLPAVLLVDCPVTVEKPSAVPNQKTNATPRSLRHGALEELDTPALPVEDTASTVSLKGGSTGFIASSELKFGHFLRDSARSPDTKNLSPVSEVSVRHYHGRPGLIGGD